MVHHHPIETACHFNGQVDVSRLTRVAGGVSFLFMSSGSHKNVRNPPFEKGRLLEWRLKRLKNIGVFFRTNEAAKIPVGTKNIYS